MLLIVKVMDFNVLQDKMLNYDETLVNEVKKKRDDVFSQLVFSEKISTDDFKQNGITAEYLLENILPHINVLYAENVSVVELLYSFVGSVSSYNSIATKRRRLF